MPPTKQPRVSTTNPQPIIAAVGLIFLGAIMVATKSTQTRDLGWILIVIGGLTAGWWTSEALRARKFQRALEADAARKAALKTTRRQRDDEERTRREVDKRAREEQAAQLHEQRADEGRRRKEAEEAAAAERVAREREEQAEIARLKSLTPEALHEDVLARLSSRGYRLDDEDASDQTLLSHVEDGKKAVLRITQGRTANATDIRELEAIRRDVDAAEGFLVCLNGFASNGVRAAQNVPITLVEAHLLASWSHRLND